MRNNQPFRLAIQQLHERSGLSYRQIAIATQRESGHGISPAFLSELVTGKKTPNPRHLEIIARAAGESPEYFREYREHIASEKAKAFVNQHGFDNFMGILERADKLKDESSNEET